MYWEKRAGAILTKVPTEVYHRECRTEAKDDAYNNISAGEDKEQKQTGAHLSPRLSPHSKAEQQVPVRGLESWVYGALDLAGGSGGIRLLCLGSDPKPLRSTGAKTLFSLFSFLVYFYLFAKVLLGKQICWYGYISSSYFLVTCRVRHRLFFIL